MRKLDQPKDLRNSEPWIVLMNLLNARPRIEAVHNGIRQDASPAHNRSTRHLARNLLNQLTR